MCNTVFTVNIIFLLAFERLLLESVRVCVSVCVGVEYCILKHWPSEPNEKSAKQKEPFLSHSRMDI